jgi:hypothetical protein
MPNSPSLLVELPAWKGILNKREILGCVPEDETSETARKFTGQHGNCVKSLRLSGFHSQNKLFAAGCVTAMLQIQDGLADNNFLV